MSRWADFLGDKSKVLSSTAVIAEIQLPVMYGKALVRLRIPAFSSFRQRLDGKIHCPPKQGEHGLSQGGGEHSHLQNGL